MSILDPKEDNNRFILSGPFDEEMPYYYIVIKDYNYWNAHETELEQWMRDYLPRGTDHQTGMVLTIEEEKDVMLFLLRWGP